MKQILISTIFASSLIMLISCQPKQQAANSKSDALISHIDTTVSPGTDFFRYANGKWFNENPISKTEQSSGIWQIIKDTIQSKILKVCQASAKTVSEKGSNKQKIGDFYSSGMDSIKINQAGIGAISKYLEQIESIKTTDELANQTAFIQSASASALFGFGVTQDSKNSSQYSVILWQGGLSLPDRSYYFDNDERTTQIREKFLKHLENIYILLRYDASKPKLTTH